jgi:crotonobetainyl-CoA:carnitine CoA-transferase CaiB-like acyl-CoA transferase
MEGLLVADFSRVLAGPLASMWMADLGATVIKVEHPRDGDDTRHWGPPWTTTSSSYFESANRSKRSVGLDLTEHGDLALAQELAARAHVLVQNFRPGGLAKFGLDYDTISRINPAQVYCSISGFGTGEGASAGLPGYDFVVQAVGGLMSITGPAEGEPTKVGVALVDVLTAKDALIGVLAALRTVQLTGRGQHVEVNLLSSLLGSMANQAGAFLASGTSPGRMGNQHPSIAPYETLHCRDGLLVIACGNDGQFAQLVDVLGIPEAAQDPDYSNNRARVENRHSLIALLEDRLASSNAAEWEARFAARRIPVGRVADIGGAFALAERLGLGARVPVGDGHPDQVAHPIRYSAMQVRPPSAPPARGEHDKIIRAWLQERRPAEALQPLNQTFDEEADGR